MLTIDIIAHGLTAGFAFSLVLVTTGTGIRRQTHLFCMLFALAACAWALTSLAMLMALWFGSGNAALLLEIATLEFCLMEPFLFLFTARFLGIKGSWPLAASIAGFLVIAVLAVPLFGGSFVSNPRLLANGTIVIDLSRWAIIASAIPGVCMTASLALLWIKRRQVKEPLLSVSVLLCMAGFLVGGMVPATGPTLSILNTAGIAAMGWVVVKKQLFNPLRERASLLDLEVAERMRAERELRARAERLELVAQVAQKTTALLSLDELLQQAVSLIRDAFDYFTVGILLVEGSELVVRASTLPSVQARAGKIRLKVGSEGICGWVAASGEPLIVPDVEKDTRYVSFSQEVTTRSELAVPIKVGPRVIGVLDTQSSSLDAFTATDLFTQRAIADQLSNAIENARLYEETRLRAERLALINRISNAVGAILDLPDLMETVYREVTPIFAAEAFFIALYDEIAGELDFRIQVDEGLREPPNKSPVGDGLTSRVIRGKKPLLVADMSLRQDGLPEPEKWGTGKVPSSWIGVPMLVGDSLVGVMSVQTYTAHHYNEEDLLFAATIADQVAVAVENARLYGEVRQELAVRLRTEQGLRESEEKFRNLAEQLPNMVFIWSKGRIVYANRQCEAIMGYTREEFYAPDFDFLTLAVSEHRDLISGKLRAHLAGEEIGPYEYALSTRDGRRMEAALTSKLIRYEEAPAILGIIIDITSRKRAESLLESLNAAALQMTRALVPREIFLAAVRELARLGFSAAILLADASRSMLAVRYKMGAAHVVTVMEEDAVEGGGWFPVDQVPAYATSFFTRETVVEEVPSWYEDGFSPVVRAVVAPLAVDEESFGLLVVHGAAQAGEEVPAITAFANQAAAAWRKTKLMQDLERSLSELKKAQEQLLHAQKMEAIGRLAGGIAHDFNNLLTVISGYANLLAESLGSEHASQAELTEIRAAIKRASALTSRLLAFGRKQILQPVVLDLSKTAENSVRLLRPLIREDIDLALNLSPTPLLVRADPYQLEQVIMNLALNARDAMPNGGTLVIRTGPVGIPERGAGVDAEYKIPSGPHAELVVQDTGIGMSESIKEHLFEPFFTTKEDGKGTGLGLSTVYGIVTQTGGRILVESAPGKGSTFTVLMPLATAEKTLAAEEVRAQGAPAGSGVILVAEDDATVRDLARRVLLKGGYSVLAASSAYEALRIAEGMGRIDLLLTDLVMPGGMNGVELGQRLALSRPGLKVLHMSGYVEAMAARFGLPDNQLTFLAKPFQIGELLSKVSELLGGPGSADPDGAAPDSRG